MKWRGIIFALGGLGVASIGVALLLSGNRPSKVAVTSEPAATVSVSPPAALDRTAYNAKMLELANLPRCTTTTLSHSGTKAPASKGQVADISPPVTSAKKEPASTGCPPHLWPVRTVFPDAGALLPFKRVVAYYGNFYSRRMGVLGEYPPDKVIAKLKAQANAWAKADPSTPVMLAVDYIVVAAQNAPGRNGKYMMRMPPAQIEKAISMADQIRGLVFLDVQPGWSTVEIEVPRLAPYLKLPNVELALDPEFALTEGKRPGAWRGTMSAADINFAARFLAKIVKENHLPPKILVVHRFTQRMVTDYRAIKPLPQVEIVMDMDGFGSPSLKTAAYRDFIARQPVQFTGFKLFYKNDVKWGGRLMTPAQVLRLSPQPSYILYQ